MPFVQLCSCANVLSHCFRRAVRISTLSCRLLLGNFLIYTFENLDSGSRMANPLIKVLYELIYCWEIRHHQWWYWESRLDYRRQRISPAICGLDFVTPIAAAYCIRSANVKVLLYNRLKIFLSYSWLAEDAYTNNNSEDMRISTSTNVFYGCKFGFFPDNVWQMARMTKATTAVKDGEMTSSEGRTAVAVSSNNQRRSVLAK
jgi:hypothetical protein